MTKVQRFISDVLLIISLVSLWMILEVYILSVHTNYTFQNTKYTAIFNNFRIQKIIHTTNNNYAAEVIDAKLGKNPSHFAVQKTGTSTIIADSSQMTTKGMILVTLFAEQQVGAAMNMFSLQKWAKHVGASVVEPFVRNSMFKLPIISSKRELGNAFRFRDYFNIDIWNNMSTLMNGSPLISWEMFINQAPKKCIFVVIVNDIRKEKRPVYINDEIMKQEYCKKTFHYFIDKYSFYIDQLLQVKIIRRVCLSFYRNKMHIDNFTNTIYGEFSSSDVVVWIQIWKGFSYSRVKVFQQYFHRTRRILTMLHTSKKILDDSQKYIKEVLKSEPGKYAAISIRTMLRAKYLQRSNHSSFFHNCIKKLGDIIRLKGITNNTIFVAMDLGRFGDSVVENFIYRSIIKKIEMEVFQTVYNNSLTMWKWEQSFIRSTNGITDSGYVAAMQRTIVENGRCLVLFGGKSNFQKTLLLTYKEKHPIDPCIYEVCYKK